MLFQLKPLQILKHYCCLVQFKATVLFINSNLMMLSAVAIYVVFHCDEKKNSD